MRAGVIGTGFGASVVAPGYEKLGIEVDLVSPRDTDGVERACTAAVDFVSIHSPPFLHRKHVLLALENRQNVVCDKPFGRTASEAREMLEAATSAGTIHLLNFEFRQDSARRQIKQLIDEGAIGTPQHVNWSMFSAGSRAMPHGWLFDREKGGGWIGAYGSHVIDALRWWVGEIADVVGVLRTEISRRPDNSGVQQACTAEDAFSAAFAFESGATASVSTAFAASVTRPQRIEVFGSDGALLLEGTAELTLKRAGEADQKFDHKPNAGDPHEPSFFSWATRLRDAVRDGHQIEPSFHDGLACATVMDKLRAAGIR